MAGRAFLQDFLADLPLFRRGQPIEKALGATSGKLKKDLGKDKPIGGPFPFHLQAPNTKRQYPIGENCPAR